MIKPCPSAANMFKALLLSSSSSSCWRSAECPEFALLYLDISGNTNNGYETSRLRLCLKVLASNSSYGVCVCVCVLSSTCFNPFPSIAQSPRPSDLAFRCCYDMQVVVCGCAHVADLDYGCSATKHEWTHGVLPQPVWGPNEWHGRQHEASVWRPQRHAGGYDAGHGPTPYDAQQL